MATMGKRLPGPVADPWIAPTVRRTAVRLAGPKEINCMLCAAEAGGWSSMRTRRAHASTAWPDPSRVTQPAWWSMPTSTPPPLGSAK